MRFPPLQSWIESRKKVENFPITVAIKTKQNYKILNQEDVPAHVFSKHLCLTGKAQYTVASIYGIIDCYSWDTENPVTALLAIIGNAAVKCNKNIIQKSQYIFSNA